MMRIKPVAWVVLAGLVWLTGCSLFTGGQPPAPPPPPEVLAYIPPTATPEPTPTPASQPASGAEQGEIVFVRDGQIWAIGADGTGERTLTALPDGSSIRDLTMAPGGQYVAFSINAQQVAVLDFARQRLVTVAQVSSGNVGMLKWSLQGDALYYHQAALDAQGLLVSGTIWRVAMPPDAAPEPVLLSDPAILPSSFYPGPALSADLLILHQMTINSDDLGRWLVFTPSTGTSVPLADGYGLWDVSPNGDKALLYNQAEVMGFPAPLYMGAFPQPPGTLVNIGRISPEGSEAAFRLACFAPDGMRIVAIQTGAEQLGQVVLFQIEPSGLYRVTPLDPQPGIQDMAFSWHGEDGVVVQRWVPGEDSPSLWLLPLDGAAGFRLTNGEQPLVVGGR